MAKYFFVIGFTGSIGSGCSETCKIIDENDKYNCYKLSLSNLLREHIDSIHILKKEHDELKNKEEELRKFLQKQGNDLRKNSDNPHILVDMAITNIKELKNKNKLDDIDFILIDSIRNISEIDVLRRHFKTYIIAIYADEDKRWNRVSKNYNNRYDLFQEDDKRDHEEKVWFGQHVDACVDNADILIKNEEDIIESLEDKKNYFKKIDLYLDLIKNPHRNYPRLEEAYMNMAYSMAARSRCLQRKVGTLITTKDLEIVSLGYNDVPSDLDSCKKKFGMCYREREKNKLLEKFIKCPKCGKKLNDDKFCKNCNFSIKKDLLKDKNLGLCRALHAEENAIVKAAKAGIPLKNGILFTTTFPCNLCAKKIRNVGLRKVIFVEPYPLKDTIEIFNKIDNEGKKIELELFEGVKSRAFFDLYKRIDEIEREALMKRK